MEGRKEERHCVSREKSRFCRAISEMVGAAAAANSELELRRLLGLSSVLPPSLSVLPSSGGGIKRNREGNGVSGFE